MFFSASGTEVSFCQDTVFWASVMSWAHCSKCALTLDLKLFAIKCGGEAPPKKCRCLFEGIFLDSCACLSSYVLNACCLLLPRLSGAWADSVLCLGRQVTELECLAELCFWHLGSPLKEVILSPFSLATYAHRFLSRWPLQRFNFYGQI